MKTTNIQTTHNQAIIRGWVDPVGLTTDSGSGGGGAVGEVQNGAGVNLLRGDVVVLALDGTVVTTTTANDTRPVGVALDDITWGEFGPIVWSGPVDLINVTASVTAGDYAATSTTAGEADAQAERPGAFGFFTSSGLTPSGFLFGGGGGSGGGTTNVGDMVPYYIAVDETFTVPIYKQALFAMLIDAVGTLVVDGYLIEVT